MKLFIKEKYGQTPNELLNRSDISLKAKGLFGFLQSKPDGWEFSKERIASQLLESKYAIRTAMKELKDNGYLETKPCRGEEGKWVGHAYILVAHPATETPSTSITEGLEDWGCLSKKDVSKKECSNKDKQASLNGQVKEVFNHFRKSCGHDISLTSARRKIIKACFNRGGNVDGMKKAINNFSKDDWGGRADYWDIVYCLGVRNKVDNYDKWKDKLKHPKKIGGRRL